MLALVYSGQIVMFVGFTFAAEAPFDYLRENWLDVPRFLAAGAIVAVFVTTIPLAVSGFTSRRAYAAGFVIGLFIISSAVANALAAESAMGDWVKWIGLADFGSVPSYVSDLIFGENPDSSDAMTRVSELNDAIPIGWYILLTAGPAALLLRRYQKAAL